MRDTFPSKCQCQSQRRKDLPPQWPTSTKDAECPASADQVPGTDLTWFAVCEAPTHGIARSKKRRWTEVGWCRFKILCNLTAALWSLSNLDTSTSCNRSRRAGITVANDVLRWYRGVRPSPLLIKGYEAYREKLPKPPIGPIAHSFAYHHIMASTNCMVCLVLPDLSFG